MAVGSRSCIFLFGFLSSVFIIICLFLFMPFFFFLSFSSTVSGCSFLHFPIWFLLIRLVFLRLCLLLFFRLLSLSLFIPILILLSLIFYSSSYMNSSLYALSRYLWFASYQRSPASLPVSHPALLRLEFDAITLLMVRSFDILMWGENKTNIRI